jgi:hypothetical protein
MGLEKELTGKPMIVLAGEQPAPNLLPAHQFQPSKVVILHTALPRSKEKAENLALRLKELHPELRPIADYDVARARATLKGVFAEFPRASVNVTGGTKPMSIAALLAAREAQGQPFYVRSQGAKTEVDFYIFDEPGLPAIGETFTIDNTITIDDYLTVYFGETYHFTGFSKGRGEVFEREVFLALEPQVDEIKAGWKHESGAVDVDLVVRCNNQIGIIEVKSGGKAGTTEGIKQLAVAGGQRFFGTYVRRILVLDRTWAERSNNRGLAEALGIVLVELPGYGVTARLDGAERARLIGKVQSALGRSMQGEVFP